MTALASRPPIFGEHQARLHAGTVAWRLSIDKLVQTPHAIVAFGHRNQQPVVLKIIKNRGDEWCSGAALDAFGGRGMVRVLEHADGAVLLERLVPGRSLADSQDINDDKATTILADVIARMSPGPPPNTAPTVHACARSFEQYAPGETSSIPRSLVETAHRTYLKLCASQTSTQLLHGDLHHHNVLLDSERGWLAVDPKGVVGEPAYELGAALRNPIERPDLYAIPATIRKRVEYFGRVLQLDTTRILAWAFAQAVLAAIWELEDDGVLNAGRGCIRLARVIREMLRGELDA